MSSALGIGHSDRPALQPGGAAPPAGTLLFDGQPSGSTIAPPWDHLVYDDANKTVTAGGFPAAVFADPLGSGQNCFNLTAHGVDELLRGSSWFRRTDAFQNSTTAWASEGKETWYSVEFMFPSAATAGGFPVWVVNPGNWNWTVQIHYGNMIANAGGESVAISQPFDLGVLTSNTAPSLNTGCGSNSSTSNNPMIFGDVTGGDVDGVDGNLHHIRWCTKVALTLDTWHRVTVHTKWSTDAALGLWEVFMDGVQQLSSPQATLLYRSTTGQIDVPNFEVDNYDGRAASWGTLNSSIFFRRIKLATTQALAES